MTFEIEHAGRVRTVTVERLPLTAEEDNVAAPPGSATDRFRVTVDGREFIVDAARLGPAALSLILAADRISREVRVDPGQEPGEAIVQLRGRSLAITYNGRRAAQTGGLATGSTTGPQRIVAPMPGRIVRVLAGPGDEVKTRQPLIVVEAMKMENELSSPRAGRVKEVSVAEGMSVEAGRVLVVVE